MLRSLFICEHIMRHTPIRPLRAPLDLPSPCYAIACGLAGALAAVLVFYATLAHFNRPLPPRANVERSSTYAKHVRVIPLHTSASLRN